jgi:hypothetical protein
MINNQKWMAVLFCLLLFFVAAPFETAYAQLCTPTGPEGPLGDASCSDAVDNDCDGLIDAADGAGGVGTETINCSDPDVDDDGDGTTENEGDCDDAHDTVYQGAQVVCDGLDNNCDGWRDYYTDRDEDLDGVAWCAGDCDDLDPLRFPGNIEGPFGDPTCSDVIDNDCDGLIDAGDPQCDSGCSDNDGDGYGFPGSGGCANGPATDCNDNDININPGASDANCDTVDDNCSGTPDDEYVTTPTGCGVGGCATAGQIECQSGAIVDTCTPLQPIYEGPSGDATCSGGVDEDCDGDTDGAEMVMAQTGTLSLIVQTELQLTVMIMMQV